MREYATQVGRLINPRRKKADEAYAQELGEYRIAPYGKTRWWAVYRGEELLVVAVYKKGAQAVVRALQGLNGGTRGENPFGPAKRYNFRKGMRVRSIGQQFQTGIPFGSEGVIVEGAGAHGRGIYADPSRVMIFVRWEVKLPLRDIEPAGATSSPKHTTFAVFHWELEPISAAVIPIKRGKNPKAHEWEAASEAAWAAAQRAQARGDHAAAEKFRQRAMHVQSHIKAERRAKKHRGIRRIGNTTEVIPGTAHGAAKPFEVWVRRSESHPWGFIKAFADYNVALERAQEMGARGFYAKVKGPILKA